MDPSSYFVVSAPFNDILTDLMKDLQSPLYLFFLIYLAERARAISL